MGGSDGGVGGWVGQFWVRLLRLWVGSNFFGWVFVVGGWLLLVGEVVAVFFFNKKKCRNFFKLF